MPDVSAEQQRKNESILDHIESNGDGYMFCVDLEHEQGREARDFLRNAYPDVATALLAVDRVKATTPLSKVRIRYLLSLVPCRGRVSSWFSHEETLPRAIQMMHEKSCQYGGMWALAIIPMDSEIADMFAKFSATAGSA